MKPRTIDTIMDVASAAVLALAVLAFVTGLFFVMYMG